MGRGFCGTLICGRVAAVKQGDLVHVKYIRPGKDVVILEEEYYDHDETCIRTIRSEALVRQQMIQSGQSVGTISEVYFFNEPFNVLEFRELDGTLLGYYSDIAEPTIQVSPAEFQMTDLFLDIWLFPDGRLLELDWDEFEEAVQKQVITPAQADLAQAAMKRLVDEATKGIYPSQYADHFKI